MQHWLTPKLWIVPCILVDYQVQLGKFISLQSFMSVSPSVCQSACLSVWPSVWPSVCPSICLSFYLYFSLSAFLSTYLSIFLSVLLSFLLSVRPSVCLSVCCPSVSLFVLICNNRSLQKIKLKQLSSEGNYEEYKVHIVFTNRVLTGI